MRLFAAVVPPDSALDGLATALPALSTALRIVPGHQRHLTVAFYGDVRDEVVADLSERLRRAAGRTPPLSLRIHGLGTFPANAARARVLWAGVAGDVAALTRLAERAVAAGRRAGAEVDEKRYRPHLTIARVRGDALDLRDVVAASSRVDGAAWTATEVVLVRSTLGAEVSHERIATWPFAETAT